MVWFIYTTQFYHYYKTLNNGIHFKGLNETILMVPITRMYNLYWQNAYGVEVLQKSQKRIKSSIGKRWVAAWIHIVEKNGLQIWNQHKISHNMSWENQNILRKGITSPPPTMANESMTTLATFGSTVVWSHLVPMLTWSQTHSTMVKSSFGPILLKYYSTTSLGPHTISRGLNFILF